MDALRSGCRHVACWGQQLPQAGDIESGSRGSLHGLTELEANLEVAAFEFEVTNVIFFKELD
jgi:hypothetical protein